jgi:YegS/Rv2252/BmrU family lipid kinase
MRSKPALQDAIRTGRRAPLVVNARSRRGRRYFPMIRERLEAEGYDLVQCLQVERPGELPDHIDKAIAAAPDLLIAGGGDGTISLAARHLAHRDIALGLLPLGTTNNFARSLGIPLSARRALDLVLTGKVADVDLGQVGDLTFANLVSIGMSGQVAAHVPHRLKRFLGRVAYPLTALRKLPWHDPFEAEIVAHGTRHTLRTHQLNIANGSSHAGRPITGDASADDRLLLVYALGGARRGHLVAATVRHAVSGSRRSLEEEPFLATDELTVITEPPLPLDVDGEIVGQTPAHIRLSANALRVIVGHDFVDL